MSLSFSFFLMTHELPVKIKKNRFSFGMNYSQKNFKFYPSWLSSIGKVVLSNSFVADAEEPGRVFLVGHAVVVNAVVGQRFNVR